MKNHHAKIALSVIALVVLVLRKTRPNLLDVTDLIIVAVGLLPWLSSLIKRAELPGGLKIEFQDLAGARDKVTRAAGRPQRKLAYRTSCRSPQPMRISRS